MQTIGIIGSRRRNSPDDYKMLFKVFEKIYQPMDEIVSGGCYTGGDQFAEVIARHRQIPIKIYYAEWTKLGKKAGHTRNTYIARDCTILIALVAPDRTGGAEDTIRKAIEMNKKIILIHTDRVEVLDNKKESDVLEMFKN